ncbi:sigma-70 family RNA polymerase sigma factor [Actinoplanes flavus]|uniref:Sigma-70 family RNA polymerase sigma factor n=1 Tax=Actinoplanes flavus TaxID=2820290 RepID=A0ABS3UF27_9ACTN|nr:sigma-70 family RNA polymerase sigma factor [Actinoplanes flavus]MBO3737363.1 sigma-70 family RNA polymerase sigma factor [Actinoplanes flavus]
MIADETCRRLVSAARAGDQRALEELIRAFLPLVYNVVGSALSRHADTDDVVQQVLLDVVRDLGSLRDPDRFRSWLLVITMREISAHRARRDREAGRAVALDDAVNLPESSGGFEELAVLRLGLHDQRRAVARAGRWLDPDDRGLFALWWQELAGRVTRQDTADALGVSLTHAGVRVHRMREQLENARAVVAALAAERVCAGLTRAADGWDGEPASLWRKRLARHVRGCGVCLRAGGDRIPVDRLLGDLALVAVPAVLAGAALSRLAETTAVAKSTTMAAKTTTAAAKATTTAVKAAAVPVTVKTATVSVAAVATLTAGVVMLPGPAGTPAAVGTPSAVSRPVTPAPPTTAAPLTLTGTRSLELVATPGRFLASGPELATLVRTRTRRTAFTVVEGLSDPDCLSLRAVNGRYLRHYAFRMKLAAPDGSAIFRADATWCPLAGDDGRVTLRSDNYPERVIHYRADGELGIDETDGTPAFLAASTWIVRKPAA